MSSHKKVVMKPIIISNTRKMVIAPKKVNPGVILSNIKLSKVPIFHEDVIYESSNCDFLKGESQEVLIVNKVNLVSKMCRTIAKCTSKGVSVETTSDDLCSLIGQNNYDTVLSALGSVFNEETKVRGILALLKKQTKYRTISTQTDMDFKCSIKKELIDTSCQTLDSSLDLLVKQKQRKRIRRQQFTPYVVKDNPFKLKKCIINIDNVIKKEDIKKEIIEEQKGPELPDIKVIVDEDSNMSCGSIGNISLSSSLPSILDLLDKTDVLLNDIEKVTNRTVVSSVIEVWDGTNIMIPVKPEDEFHIATPDILKNVTREERLKLLWHQAYVDFKMCVVQNEEGYYPLHIAVLHNDVDLIRRQCLALRARRESVDKPAGDMTALQMSIRRGSSAAATLELLRHGADPLLGDAARRSALHLAAEAAPAQLTCLLDYCDTHAREVLKNNEEYWKPELEDMTDAQLATYLYEKVGEMFDDEGSTPLMAAARGGRAAAAASLAARAPALVDAASPAGGDTALYQAVCAACVHAKDTGNRTSTPEHYLKTIELLVGHGADPTIENHSGSSVNSLLTDFNISALSMTIANKMSAMKHGKLASNMMLYKHKDGRIAYEDVKGTKEAKKLRIKHTVSKSNASDKSVNKDKDTSVTVDFGLKRKQEAKGTDVGIKEAKCVKTVTLNNTNVRGKNVGLDVRADKVTGLEVLTKNQNAENKKSSKIVIVENVSLNTDSFRLSMPSGSTAVKPKDVVLRSPRKILNKPRDTMGFVKIAPKIVAGNSEVDVCKSKTKKLNSDVMK